MILLDTNVVSELMSQNPELRVIDWVDRQPQTALWTTSITVFEIWFGIQDVYAGRRKKALADAFELLLARIGRRIALFDEPAARQTGDLMALRKCAGTIQDVRDSMIGGIALANRATVATRNTKHFSDLSIPVLNPWD